MAEKKDEKKPGLTSSKNGIDIEDKQYKNEELDQPSELTHEGMDAAASANLLKVIVPMLALLYAMF